MSLHTPGQDDSKERSRILQEYLRQTGKTGVIAVAIDATHNASFTIVLDGLVCPHMVEFLEGLLDVAKVMLKPYGEDDQDPAEDQMPEAHQSPRGPH